MSNNKKLSPARWMGAGIAIGVALGAAMKNVGAGLAIGVALGAALVAAEKRRQG
jgi:hypothetical protein